MSTESVRGIRSILTLFASLAVTAVPGCGLFESNGKSEDQPATCTQGLEGEVVFAMFYCYKDGDSLRFWMYTRDRFPCPGFALVVDTRIRDRTITATICGLEPLEGPCSEVYSDSSHASCLEKLPKLTGADYTLRLIKNGEVDEYRATSGLWFRFQPVGNPSFSEPTSVICD